jgi:hypothetical protein
LTHAQIAVRSDPDIPAMKATLALAYAATSQPQKARETLALIQPADGKLLPAEAAFAYVRLGDTDEAFKTLDTAAQQGMLWSVSLPLEPTLNPIRSDPRFPALERRVHAGSNS